MEDVTEEELANGPARGDGATHYGIRRDCARGVWMCCTSANASAGREGVFEERVRTRPFASIELLVFFTPKRGLGREGVMTDPQKQRVVDELLGSNRDAWQR